jgi:hypothetical protein
MWPTGTIDAWKGAVMGKHRAARRHVVTWIVITILLAAALIGTLWVPFYNHTPPTLWGFPFFYWYQLMWVPIVAILGAVAYLLSKVAQRGNAAASARSRDAGQGEAS